MRTFTLDQITLCADGSVGVRLMKIISDGEDVVWKEPHRVTVGVDAVASDVIRSVYPSLEQMGYTAAISDEELAHVDAVTAAHRAVIKG